MLSIQKQFIKYNISPRNEVIKYICLHDVGTHSTAQNNRDYFAKGDVGASADFFVDSINIIQLFDYMKNYGWSIGDGRGKYGITNKNSISIEMCLESNLRPSILTVTNTINLVQKLMRELNIPLERVVRHYDASHKSCPHSFSDNNWQLWNEFKKQLSRGINVATDDKITLLQKVCNRVGIRGNNGKPLVEDGIDGLNTQGAKARLIVYIVNVTK